MNDIWYSSVGIMAIIIHCIINRSALLFSKKEKDYLHNIRHKFLGAVLLYYITDALWGVLDALHQVNLLKVDTFVYYIAMCIAVIYWCDYAVAYLQKKNFFGKILKYFGRIFVIFEVCALCVNMYKPIFYWFDKQGEYHAGIVRYIALYIQIAMFCFATIQAIFVTLRTTGIRRRRHLAICLFGITMIIAIVAQIFYPMLPIYTMGYLVGICFLHSFVEEDEKDEHIVSIRKQMNIVSSMAGIYFCSYYVDMKNKTFIEIDNKISENDDFIGKTGDARETLEKMCQHLVLPEYMKEMQEFTRLDTLDERLDNQKYYISNQFKSVHLGWAEGYFIASDRDKDGKLNHVIWAIRTINDEKEKEEKLFYNSYIDELTGLYNRKMYSEDCTENLHKFMKQDFVYVSMDVNGLKVINDTKGHAAGDELIKGAAACMKQAMSEYGRVYRTGGDEFIAMLNVEPQEMKQIVKRFEQLTAEFKGVYVDFMSVSIGYVVWRDNQTLSLEEIEKLADERMYHAKKIYYTTNGVDRRGQQQNAYKALCTIYTKILLVNLTEDQYHIIYMDEEEQSEEKGFSQGIFSWLENFAKQGQVHPEDLELYYSTTNKEYLLNYFGQNKTSLSFIYRRKTENEFKLVEMEIIPTEDYRTENQTVYMYVKAIDK